MGGLGRGLSRWMVARGARHLVFLGRSGADKPAASRLVGDLEQQGAKVVIVKGDMINYSDVERAVTAAQGHIGGVVQAAMGLHVSLQAPQRELSLLRLI